MSKRNKILLGVCAFVYVFALIVFHMTYNYTMYWVDESTMIVIGSLIYILIGLILYWALSWKASMLQIPDISIKMLTGIVACASVLRTLLCIFDRTWFDYPIINTMGWMMISVFFFVLYKKMR